MQEKLTVDRLMRRGQPEQSYNYAGDTAGSAIAQKELSQGPQLFEMVLVVAPEDCEILDNKIVIVKRVISESREQALRLFGVKCR